MTKIITINNKKGGTGKTAVATNLAVYLAKFGKTCIIDADESGNCTERFTQAITPGAELCRLFRKEEVFPMTMRKNIDLVAGTFELEDVNRELNNRPNNHLIFAGYLRNFSTFAAYDYIVIDTRNDSNITTNNILIASDLILGVSDPSAAGYEALINLKEHVNWLKEELIDIFTGQSYVHAEIKFIGNKVAHNTDVSTQFKQLMASDTTFIGYFQERIAYSEAELQRLSLLDIFDQPKYQQKKYDVFKQQTLTLLETIHLLIETLPDMR